MSAARLAVLTLAALAFGVMGCGGSAKSANPTAHTETGGQTVAKTTGEAQPGTGQARGAKHVTKAELLVKANAICARIRARVRREKPASIQALGREAPGIASYEHEALRELDQLVPPASLRHNWKRVVRGIELLASDAATLGEYARAKRLETPAGRALIIATGNHGKHEAVIARRIGLGVCAETI